ncbi:AMP-binding protein, partial [Klebsiella sp. Ap-874]|uniref:AMP-binding protein n=1 Tax=Klebsiella sp. Ap-874 TaxID=2608352 RepID=UPI00141A27D5
MTEPHTLCAAFQATATIDPDAVAVRTVGDTHVLTWREYAEQVRAVAAGLSGLGVGRGDTVALMMANRVEFYPIEVGAQHVGATSFSVYDTLAPDQLAHVFANAGNRVVFCEARYVERIRACGVPIETIVCLDAAPPGTLSLAELTASARDDFDFEATWRAVRSDDIATLCYTSGTTGNPKGVEVTHANLLAEDRAFTAVMPVYFGDRQTSYLPSAHMADRFTALYLHEIHGVTLTVVPDRAHLSAALVDTRPTIWGAVPRVWEKFKAAIEFSVAGEPDPARKAALAAAMGLAARRAEAALTRTPLDPDLAAAWAEADARVLSPLRAK